MKKLTIGFLMSFAILAGTAEASRRFHPNHLFIKMKAGEGLVKSPLIKSSKKIIGSLYLVKTQDPEALAQELNSLESVEYSQKDFYGEKRQMPKLE
jgi:hypothetical protein